MLTLGFIVLFYLVVVLYSENIRDKEDAMELSVNANAVKKTQETMQQFTWFLSSLV
ncbi:hypothetical protein [Bacillus cihuensis]|uniref:hypothetical protein n=1 Tax=Bacillus cihuensis TaxID=1208599 RepID=UPI000419E79D|nr:hypothetical protein [Bacillus cihuensis]